MLALSALALTRLPPAANAAPTHHAMKALAKTGYSKDPIGGRKM